MEQNLNDKTACLVTAFQSGDVSAFSTLYDMHINLLFNYGCKLTTDKELLKDCIHDVFVKLYTKKAELGIIDNFKSYLLISLKNKLCDELRRRMFMSETAVEELNPVAAGDDVEHQYLEKEKSCFENIKVKHLLAQLSPRQREALTLGEFYQFNLSSCIRQQNSLTAQFVSFSLSNLANIFYPPPIFTIINLCLL